MALDADMTVEEYRDREKQIRRGQMLYDLVTEQFPEGKAAKIPWESLDKFESTGWAAISQRFLEQLMKPLQIERS